MTGARPARAVSVLLVCAALVAQGCAKPTVPPAPETAQLNVQAVFAASAPIATLVVVVTGPGIVPEQGLVFNLEVSNGTATGRIDVPTGADRLFTVSAYDGSNVKTHTGAKTVTVQAGSNPLLSITLMPLAGAQEITVTFSSFAVSVSPATATVAVNGTTRLEATVRVGSGPPIAAEVRWATSNPAVARVSTTGLVTGVAPGTASVMATYNGVGAAATITVP